MKRSAALLAAMLLGAACDSGENGPHLVFDPAAKLDEPLHFYDQPFPLDTRLVGGKRRVTAMPRPNGIDNLEAFVLEVNQAEGAPVVPVAYFLGSVPLAPRDAPTVIPAEKTSPFLLIDIDASSPERGRLRPTVAMTLEVDEYTPPNLIAVAPRPGFVLLPHTRYAMLVMRSSGTLDGKPLDQSRAISTLRNGGDPGGGLKETFAPLWATLAILDLDAAEIASATVFTTNDVVADLAALGDAVIANHTVTIANLALDPDDGAAHPRFCELHGTVTLPQFQKGTPPFNTDGQFVFDASGALVEQTQVTVPIVVTLPNTTMPTTGFPLDVYLHGSGGFSTAAVDRGTWRPVTDTSVCPDGHTDEWLGVVGCNIKGEGPAHVIAEYGFGTFAAALPVNPERLPGADDTAYLNFINLAGGRDLFRQGVIEQRLILDAVVKLQIAPSVTTGCAGLDLKPGSAYYKFDPAQVYGQGQSMGGQYINMLSATESRIRAVAPTGAGGFWSLFILETPLVPGGAAGPILLGTMAKLSFMHPALHLFEQAWEPVDPMVYMPRIGARPLPGHPVRPIYEPVGIGDSFFPTTIYDAVALAYGNRQAGTEVWPAMQPALELDGRKGLDPYPVKDNRMSETTPYTGVVVQYEGDGVYDPHAIYTQLPAVKRQLGCFFSSMRSSDKATVVAPDQPCP